MHPKTITIHISIIHNKTFGQENNKETLIIFRNQVQKHSTTVSLVI